MKTGNLESAQSALREALLSGDFEAHEKAKGEIASIQTRQTFGREHAATLAAEAQDRERKAAATAHAKGATQAMRDALEGAADIQPAIITFAREVREPIERYRQFRAAASALLGHSLDSADQSEMIEHSVLLHMKLAGAPSRAITTDPDARPVDLVIKDAMDSMLGEVRKASRSNSVIAAALAAAGL